MAVTPIKQSAKASPTKEIGVTGLRVYSGSVDEEFLRELKGERGRRTLREMSENDATVGAMLAAIGLFLRAVTWEAEPAKEDEAEEATAEAQEAADFAESLLDDMSHTWEDFISEVLTMLVYGWHYCEIVYKRRVGPTEADPAKRSRHDDGKIGIRKLSPRSQETLDKWEMQEDGGVSGMWQRPPTGRTNLVFIPIERALLFRTVSRRNSPEGVSVLRTAYRSWWFLKRIQESEAIGIERDLAGLPVVKIPSKYLSPDASPAELAVKQQFERIVRDLRFNEQGGVLTSSEPYTDGQGNPTSIPQVDVQLLNSGGARTIDTVAVKGGYQRDMTRSVLADFIMLGSDSKGSYALSENKSDLFLRACEAILRQVEAPLNRFLLPRVWELNNMDLALLPRLRPGRLNPVDLEKLARFLQQIAAAGAPVFPDEELEGYLREEAGLPAKSPEALQAQDEMRQQEAEQRLADLEATRAGAEATLNPPPKPLPPGAGKAPAKKAFDPSQPRDDHGRWTEGGGSSADYTAELQRLSGDNQAFDRLIDQMDKDRSMSQKEVHEVAVAYLGYGLARSKQRKWLIQRIKDRQALDARQTARINSHNRLQTWGTKEFDPSQPRDDHGRWTGGGGGGPGFISSLSAEEGLRRLPIQARTEQGAEQVFNRNLRELNSRGVEFYHEVPGDVAESVRREGIRSDYGVFASVGEPSQFVRSDEKTIVRFRLPSSELGAIVPDMSYHGHDGLTPHQLLLLSAGPRLQGAYVSYSDSIPSKWITGVEVRRRGSQKAFDPSQPRDDHGRWSDTGGGGGPAPLSHERVVRTAESVASRLGYHPANVIVHQQKGAAFEVHGKKYVTGGLAHLDTGRIDFFQDEHVVSEKQVEFVVAHEVMHQKFERFLEAYVREKNAAQSKWVDDTRNHSMFSPDGRIREEYLDVIQHQYPTYASLYDVDEGDDLLNPRHLMDEDGVTEYSTQYWEGFRAGQMDSKWAIHETMAEIEALEYNDPGNLRRRLKQRPKFDRLYQTVNDWWERNRARRPR